MKGNGVCSYKFEENNKSQNELKISNYSNLKIGLYYYSEYWDEIVDYKIFEPKMCQQLKYCKIGLSEQPEITFHMQDALFIALNLMPSDSQKEMQATVEYRAIIKESGNSLIIVPICFLLMLLFTVLMY